MPDHERTVPVIAVTTTVMACSMSFLQMLGAQGPRLRDLADLDSGELGVVVALAFLVASLASAAAARLVGRIGPRRCSLLLLAGIAATFGLAGALPSVATLAVAAPIAGFAQALANPATNVTLTRQVPPERRPLAIGVKQAGVQLGALVFGFGLTLTADALDFGTAMAIGAGVVALVAIALVRVVPADRPTARGGAAAASEPEPTPELDARLRVLRRYSFLIGCGIAVLNAYLGLYAHDSLGVSVAWAGAPAALLGLAGLLGRVAWVRHDRTRADPTALLPALALGAAAATGLLALAPLLGDWPAWPAIVLLGVTAVGANTLSVAAVVTTAPAAHIARGSAIVSGGFFLGFVVAPPLFAAAQSGIGYGAAWAATAVAFGLAATLTQR